VVWTLQGPRPHPGQFDDRVRLWILVGLIVGLAGLAMAVTGLRRR